MRAHIMFALLLVVAAPARLWADATDDAEQLKAEATQTLKANAAKTVPPQDYAMAIYRLEKAQSVLLEAGQTNTSLAQEVNSALFWARRCSNVFIVKELEKIHASNPPLKLASETKRKAAKALGQGEIDLQEEAKAAFLEAQEFAKAHKNDDYMVGLRYFQMAAEHPGTDYALKAMTLAAEAQMRFAINSGTVKEEIPDTPEMKPVQQAEALVADGKLEAAFELYKASIKLKDTLLAHRKFGHAFFRRAQQMKDELNADFEAFAPQYKAAYDSSFIQEGHGKTAQKRFNPESPGLAAANTKYKELLKRANDALVRYMYAQWEFEKVLKLAPGGKDFDAAAYQAMSVSARPDSKYKAQEALRKFLKDYQPANETERLIYEFCKTELERLGK